MTEQVKSSYTEQEIEQMDTQALLQLYQDTHDENLKWPLALRYSWLVKNVANKVFVQAYLPPKMINHIGLS